MKASPWRTAGTLLLFGLMVLAAVWMCSKEARPGIVPMACGSLVTLGLAAAGKSAFEKHVEARK